MDTTRYIAKHVINLPRSGIRDFFEIVAKMKDVISLGIGEPDFDTPWHIREAAIYALEKGKTHYTSNLGLIELRRAINRYVEKNFNVSYRPEDEILVTVGVSEALDIAFRALINPGDKVMFHQPCYVSYHPSITLAHGVAVPVPTFAKDNFALTAEALLAAWQPGCKLLMLNLPCNPTGGTCNRAQLEAIAKFCVEKDLLVLSDEIYSELTFEGEHVSIASLPGHERAHDFSARIFQGVRDDRLAHRLRLRPGDAHRSDDEGASILDDVRVDHQPGRRDRGACARRGRHEKDARTISSPPRFHRAPLQRNRPEMPSAARLVLRVSSIEITGMNEKDFALGLLQAEKVAMVPGTAFGANGAGFCRACFATGYEQLIEASDRIERYVQGLAGKR